MHVNWSYCDSDQCPRWSSGYDVFPDSPTFKCDKMLQHLPCDEKMFKLELVLRSEKYLICKY